MSVSAEAGESHERNVRVGRAEIEELIEFWRGRRANFSPAITDGVEYIKLLEQAAASPFLGDMSSPPDLQSLADEASRYLRELTETDCRAYRDWVKIHPQDIAVKLGETWHFISGVALNDYRILPEVEGVVVGGPVEVRWVDEEEDDDR